LYLCARTFALFDFRARLIFNSQRRTGRTGGTGQAEQVRQNRTGR
jgi:hypothetical protein